MGIFNKFKQALVNTSNKISTGIDNIFNQKGIDEGTLLELEDLLISSDVSYSATIKLLDSIKNLKFSSNNISSQVIKESLTKKITEILSIDKKPLNNSGLHVFLVSGVNGSGKTTTIGKLAYKYQEQGKKIAIAACDTFRAAAVEQLETWAKRSNVKLIKGNINSDPASIAYEAMQTAIAESIDILFIDTAGRLHNYQNLMDELAKIIRVIKKLDETQPLYSLLVLDGTTGQNVYNQVEQFSKIANINGLIITKLDGSARGGSVVSIVDKFKIPIYYIGVGEKISDLKEFSAENFAQALISS